MRYRPTRAAAVASRAGEGEEVEGGADDMSDEEASGVGNKNNIGDDNSVAAPVGVADNGLGEPAAKFFQRGTTCTRTTLTLHFSMFFSWDLFVASVISSLTARALLLTKHIGPSPGSTPFVTSESSNSAVVRYDGCTT